MALCQVCNANNRQAACQSHTLVGVSPHGLTRARAFKTRWIVLMLNQDNRAVYDGKVCTVGADEQMPQAAASKTSGTDKHQLAKDVYAQMLLSEEKGWSRLLEAVDPFVIQRLVNELQKFQQDLDKTGGSEATSVGQKTSAPPMRARLRRCSCKPTAQCRWCRNVLYGRPPRQQATQSRRTGLPRTFRWGLFRISAGGWHRQHRTSIIIKYIYI